MMAHKDTLPYRDCVGICLFNTDNKVWIGNRYGASELENSSHTWQMPQGGIDKGEEPLEAAIRELYEETSIQSVSLIREAPEWLQYDFPDYVVKKGKIGKYKGQRQRWFAFRFEGDESEIDVINPAEGKHPTGIRRLALGLSCQNTRPHRALQTRRLSGCREGLRRSGRLS